MIAIIDYGVGNLFSLKSSFSAIGFDTVVTRDSDILAKAKSCRLSETLNANLLGHYITFCSHFFSPLYEFIKSLAALPLAALFGSTPVSITNPPLSPT